MNLNPLVTVTTRIRSPGRARYKLLKPLRGECRVYSGVTVVTTLVCLFYFAREAAGALGTRHSLRPLFSWAKRFMHDSGASRREIAESYLELTSLRGEKQRSNSLLLRGNMDCFAEPVIGRAFARPVGSQ
jgi:hypothetical protein